MSLSEIYRYVLHYHVSHNICLDIMNRMMFVLV